MNFHSHGRLKRWVGLALAVCMTFCALVQPAFAVTQAELEQKKKE